jgi:hypothetical protein
MQYELPFYYPGQVSYFSSFFSLNKFHFYLSQKTNFTFILLLDIVFRGLVPMMSNAFVLIFGKQCFWNCQMMCITHFPPFCGKNVSEYFYKYQWVSPCQNVNYLYDLLLHKPMPGLMLFDILAYHSYMQCGDGMIECLLVCA